MDKKFSEQSLIQLLHAAMENRWEAGFNQDLSSLLSTTHDLSMYSIAEAFWFIELAKALARNHDPRGVELVQKMFTDHVLATFYAKQTPGTSSLGDEMRAILGNFGAKETLTWLSRVEGQNYSSALYPYPSPPLKVEMNKIAERLGLDPQKRLTNGELKGLLITVKNGTKNDQQDYLLSRLVSNEYNLADFVIDHEAWTLLALADALEETGDPRGKVLLCKMCQDAIPGSSEFGEALEISIAKYGGVEARHAFDAMRQRQ